MEEKYYQLGTYTEEQWDSLYQEITEDGCSCEFVPGRCVVCDDEKRHSSTRGTYLLTEEEAATLKNDPRVKFINIDFSKYPETYKPPPDELHASSPALIQRYAGTIKHYREFEVSNTLDQTPEVDDSNRTGYQLLRCQQKLDPWIENGYTDNFVVESTISQYGTGLNIDVIVGDDGMWFGHPEFQNNTVLSVDGVTDTESPTGYIGGNVLPGNGTCDLLDLVLDAPYYLDPEYFDADPGVRLTTRWDGTTVPDEAYARNWWASAAYRSARFASIGSIIITSSYTRANCNGSNSARPYTGGGYSVGQHGTPCCALTYGRTQGWAYNANKWALNVYNLAGSDIEQYFDMMKIFHLYKPVNEQYGTRNPTISSNSWGYRASKGTTNGYYHFRGTATQYGGTASEPAFISHMGSQGDSGRWKSEMKTNSYTEALSECINSGVIFVAAAGNSNQKQVGSEHPDWNNRVSATSDQTMYETSYYEFGFEVTGSTNRRGFPQQGGMYDDQNSRRVYPVINIGALDDDYKTSLEAKVGYSDRGEEINVYAPADGTLAANKDYTNEGPRPDTYSGFTYNSGVAYDCAFGGTSAACPVAAGLIASVLEHNRDWTWREVKNWLKNLDVQDPGNFYYGIESTTATGANWFDYQSLEGGDARVLYQGKVYIRTRTGTRSYNKGNFVMRGGLKFNIRK